MRAAEPGRSPTSPPDQAPETAESQLLLRLRSGEEAAYADFVRNHMPRFLAVARRLLGNDEDARDAVQDAFLSALKGLGSFSEGSRLSTWLHRIVVNVCLMKIRSRKSKKETSIEHLLPTFLPDGHSREPAAPWNLPSEEQERRETRVLVRAMIDHLPEGYRTVLLLRDIEELSGEEVARSMDMTEGAVKVRLHRARQALRKLLDPHFREAAC
jgi:RNA polymerase sigma-70 factor (ECF subfamily)